MREDIRVNGEAAVEKTVKGCQVKRLTGGFAGKVGLTILFDAREVGLKDELERHWGIDGKIHGAAPRGPQARRLTELLGDDWGYMGGAKGKGGKGTGSGGSGSSWR